MSGSTPRRKSASGASDDDVLRRLALQPNRINHDIEENREGEQCRRGNVDRKTQDGNGARCKHEPERECFRARYTAARNRALGGAGHQCVDVSVVPHVEHARGASARGNAEKGDETDAWIKATRRN
jgi:hypothetical protein